MKRILYILPLLFLGCACSELVEGINQDPNNPTSASYQNILTGSQVGNIVFQTGESARRAGIFCGYYTGLERQHLGFNNYSLTTSDFNALWSDCYIDTYRNALETERAAADEGLAGITLGIAQVMQGMSIGAAAALYGDVPFQEAGQIEIENPAYQPQSEVYNQVQVLLDAAIANLETGVDRPAGGADIYFDGNAASWIETAYTLKARFYMHTKEYANAYAAAQNGISSMANSLYGPHGTGQEESNLTYLFFAVEVRGADVKTDDFIVSLLHPDAGTNPIPENYRGNAKTDETGRYNFYFSTTNIGVQPNTENGFAEQTAPAPIVTYEENLLILAEAGYRAQGFDTGLMHLNEFRAFMNGGGYLRNVPTADINYEAYVAADFGAGGVENPDNLSADEALLREILEERYVTFFGQLEGFNDMRRTLNESNVAVPVPANVGADLPARFLYPQTELDRNASLPTPIPGLFQTTPVNQ